MLIYASACEPYAVGLRQLHNECVCVVHAHVNVNVLHAAVTVCEAIFHTELPRRHSWCQ